MLRLGQCGRLLPALLLAGGCGSPAGPGSQPSPSPSPVAVPADLDPVVAAAGDLVCGDDKPAGLCKDMETSDLVLKRDREQKLAAVLPVGDLQYQFGFYDEFLRHYEASWGRLKAISRPVTGNHEYEAVYEARPVDQGGAPNGYFDYWNGRGAFTGPAGPRDRGYYSFDVGEWHLVALNSNCRFVGGCQAGSPQERWLRTDLEQNKKPCTLTYWHYPRFSSGEYGNFREMEPFWQALYEYGAEVVLSAHDHLYERFAPQTPSGGADPARGLRQFTVGTGGRSLYQMKTLQPNSEVRYRDDYGVLFLTLRPAGYTWKFVSVGGGFIDTDSGACH